jgi:type VI protein secretion system component Hcp
MKSTVLVCQFLLFISFNVSAQYVGVVINNPTEKFQVNGVMHTTQGGVRFPDGTLQATAALYANTTGEIPEYAVQIYFSYDNGSSSPPPDYADWVKVYMVDYNHYRDPGNPKQPSLENLTIIKTIDQFSTDLYRKNFSRVNLKDSEIHFTRTIKGMELPVLVSDIQTMIITNINKSTNSTGNGKYKLVEEYSLATNGAITLTYNEYDNQGNVTFSYLEVICN